MAQVKKSNSSFSESLILLIGIIVISYSTFQTAKGFETNTGGVLQAWVWAILIGLSLSYLALELRRKLLNGNKAGATIMVLCYLFVALFSFVANFNSFYSGEQKDRILSDHIDKVEKKIQELKTEYSRSTNELPNKVQRMKITLKHQMLDPNLPDWGVETQKIINDLEKVLGVKITKPAGTPEQKLSAVSTQIDDLLNTYTKKTNDFQSEIDSKVTDIERRFKDIQVNLNLAETNNLLNEAEKLHNNICNEALALIHNDNFKCDSISSSHDREIGQIQYTLKSAQENPMEAIMPALQSALLDLVLPFMILVSSSSRVVEIEPQFPKRP
ncbi:MAG: hypothetical protein NTV43_03695 [Methylococcales bacterium]|nr:hypothetical protein [Methylococcales bacterium]